MAVESALRLADQGHDRIADGPFPARQQPVLGRGRRERPALARADRFGRRPEGFGGPRLDFDDHQLPAATADEVDLAPAGREARAYHHVAAPLDELARRLLPGATAV